MVDVDDVNRDGFAIVDTVVVVLAVVGWNVVLVAFKTDVTVTAGGAFAVDDAIAKPSDGGMKIGGGEISQFLPRYPDGLVNFIWNKVEWKQNEG